MASPAASRFPPLLSRVLDGMDNREGNPPRGFILGLEQPRQGRLAGEAAVRDVRLAGRGSGL